MRTVDGLFVDKDFIIDTFLSSIEEERQRIVSAGLMSQKECDRILHKFLQKTAATNTTKDEMISRLSQLYDSMRAIQLNGDKIEEEQVHPEINESNKTAKCAEMIGELENMVFKFGSSGNHKIAQKIEEIIKMIEEEIGE